MSFSGVGTAVAITELSRYLQKVKVEEGGKPVKSKASHLFMLLVFSTSTGLSYLGAPRY